VCELVELERACGTYPSLCSNMRALPFIGSRGAHTLSRVPTGGPGDILNNIHIGALNATDSEIFLFGPSVVSLAQGLLPVTCVVGDLLSL
jgi:hypothetical protein